jgi:ribosomal protein L34E
VLFSALCGVVLCILLLVGNRTRNTFYAPTAITPSVKNALEMFLNGIHHKKGESDKKYSKKKKNPQRAENNTLCPNYRYSSI